MDKINIVIVEDQSLFRQGLSSILQSIPEFLLVGNYENGKEFINDLPSLRNKPNVALIDMNMPEMNGLELTEKLQKEAPEIKIIVLSAYDQERFIIKMTEAGASAYLPKNCEASELISAIQSVHNTGYYINDAFLNAMKSKNRYKPSSLKTFSHIPIELTIREREILQMICQQYTNAEIAERLYLSVRTIDGHRNNLLAKTGARNSAGLVLFAVRNQLFDPTF